MLHRAIEKHRPPAQAAVATNHNYNNNKSTAQRINNRIADNPAHQDTIEGAFKSSQPPNPTATLHTAPTSWGTAVATTARPSGSTLSNAAVARKGLSDSMGSLLNTLNNAAAFQETFPSASVSNVQTTINVTALHAAVYFEEDDFVDDDELDFTFEEIMPADLKAVAATLPSDPPVIPTSLPTPPEVIDLEAPPSSGVAIPWSSSPLSHFQAAPKPAQSLTVPRRVPTRVYSQESVSQQRKADAMSAGKLNQPKQPRGLPTGWSKARAAPIPAPAPGPIRTSNPIKTRKPDTASKAKAAVITELEKKIRPVAWDLSASDFKAATKDYKVKNITQKRSISTIAPDEDGSKKKARKQRLPEIFLSDEQKSVLKLVVEKEKSVFFTGSAGTGKSVLMREIIQQLRRKYPDSDRVAVTASTGLAACNIGGVTLHSFGGIGLGREAPADLVRKIKRNPKAKNRWLRTKVLIVDEISMVDGELFDKLEAVARLLRNNGRPFGGIQLVITGDFFQLPPVPESGKIQKFAFEADTWNTSIEHTIGLTHVFRQRDPVFAGVLNEMRLGSLSEESCQLFAKLSRPLEFNDRLEATELFPTRQEVDRANNQRMSLLPGEPLGFDADDTGSITDKTQRDKLLSNCMAPARIELKVDAQVMLIKNVDESLVNGSLGRVVGFMNEKTYGLCEDAGFPPGACIEEPYDESHGDNALVRRHNRIMVNIMEQQVADTAKKWPLVQFTIPDGTMRQFLAQPESWKIELPNGEVQAQRTQIPLILAWALSIHKAQGQTLERVKVDLGRIFEKGQAYVALSRATCQEGLQILRFDRSKVKAHDKVRQFYASLYSAQDAQRRMSGGNTTKTVMTPNSEEYQESDEEALRYYETAY